MLRQDYADTVKDVTLTNACYKILSLNLQKERVYIQVGVYATPSAQGPSAVKEYTVHQSNDVEGNTPFADFFSQTALSPLDKDPYVNAEAWLLTQDEYQTATQEPDPA
jgi:hypothetical protein